MKSLFHCGEKVIYKEASSEWDADIVGKSGIVTDVVEEEGMFYYTISIKNVRTLRSVRENQLMKKI